MITAEIKKRLEANLEDSLKIIRDLPVEVQAVIQPPKAQPAPSNDNAAFAFGGADGHGRFYDYLRSNDMLGPTISKTEYGGCEAIIMACAAANWPISYVAYALATAYHETAHTMLPIKEIGGSAYFHRMYDINGNRPNKARELGNTTPGDGAKYPGMGYVQLTGKSNYIKAGRELGYDLVNNPELAMRPDIAAAIMVLGMQHGWFTARKLSDDLPLKGIATLKQFVMSRDIINGTDKDDEIAAYAVDFQIGLLAGNYQIAA